MTPVRNFKMLTPSPGSNNRQGVTLITVFRVLTSVGLLLSEKRPNYSWLKAVRPGHLKPVSLDPHAG
jgi:hypothetical protein